MKTNKVYVHHRYSNSFFKRIAHNTTDRVFQIKEDDLGIVYCKYKNQPYEFHFTLDMEDYQDGINFFSILELKKEVYNNIFRDGEFSITDEKRSSENKPTPIYFVICKLLEKTFDLVKTYKNWYIDITFGEKLLWFDISNQVNLFEKNTHFVLIYKLINKFRNHIILTDNISLNSKLPNHIKYLLTNTIFFWNERTDILLYYEYGKHIHPKLNFDYLFNYNIRMHRTRRKKIGYALNKEYCFVSQTDFIDEYENYNVNKPKFELIENAYYNKVYNETDFYNALDSYYSMYKVGLDLYLRLLPKGEIQILDETLHSEKIENYLQYLHLSEKTYGLLLANISIIPTTTAVIDALYFVIPNCPKYPFENEIKQYQKTPETFVKFIDIFYENRENYKIILKNWTNEVHTTLMKTLETENSFLDLIGNNSLNNVKKSPLI